MSREEYVKFFSKLWRTNLQRLKIIIIESEKYCEGMLKRTGKIRLKRTVY